MSSLPESIKALQIQPEHRGVKIVQIPFASQDLVKHLPDDQVIIRVRAVGLNPPDWQQAFSDWGTPGTIAGGDSAGDVVKVGSAVKHLKVGDRAAGLTLGGSYQTENGAFAEYVRFVAAVCFKLPESMTYEEAVSFPTPHLTAVLSLFRLNIPKPLSPNPKRETIFIWGGSTAVGHHAVQLAALAGLRVFVTASPAVHEDLKALGAEACFDYKDTDVVKKVLAAAGEEDIIYGLDAVCEKGSTDNCIDVLSPSRGGHLIVVLPVEPETEKRRKDVKVEFILVHTQIGFPIELGYSNISIPVLHEDKNGALEHVSVILPHILENWKAGHGSPNFKTQRLRHLEGGLERIQEGLEIMRDGKYGREKLVYTIA
ncbi:chaperonin 10-like protein [Rhodocollybia butyracea]|uniref:Chaperonin 10-like protein n=1 Tax=Rhodocollybia butyracea TaxID=206335 RepID=A0A9P5PMY0_9AGAR|nr:chaperonin 10-like protein [Rhodocollybia butyracea]